MSVTIKTEDTFDPNAFLDTVIEKLHLKNDAALSRAMEVAPPVVSKMRHGHITIGPAYLMKIMELMDISVRELRAMMQSAQDVVVN